VVAAGEVPSLAVLSPRILVSRDGAAVDPALTAADLDVVAHRFLRQLREHASRKASRKASASLVATLPPRYIVSKLPNHFEVSTLLFPPLT
jgi:hypothetical protein